MYVHILPKITSTKFVYFSKIYCHNLDQLSVAPTSQVHASAMLLLWTVAN